MGIQICIAYIYTIMIIFSDKSEWEKTGVLTFKFETDFLFQYNQQRKLKYNTNTP